MWQSQREYGANMQMQADVPAGLHIDFGVADVRTHSQEFGGFETKRPVVIAFIAPDDGAQFETEVGAGTARSFGVHISYPDAAERDPCIGAIVKAVQGQPMAILGGEAARRAAKLQLGIDTWFQGDTREMVFQSRAMELVAIAAEGLRRPDRQLLRSIDLARAHTVMEQIEHDLGQSFRLDDLAKHNAIDVRLMTAAFRRAYGESIGKYIARRRMEEAARLISEGASVKSTAYKLGYTPNAFSTAFRKYFGYSPSRS